MADAITITEVRIHCDTCHHEFPGQPPDWHNKDCPKCGAPDIITDRDMAIWLHMNALREAANEWIGDVGENPEAIMHVTFSTAPEDTQ